MNVLVVGYGRVGIRTAKIIAEEGHEVTIVDNDPEKIDRARDRGFTAIEGDGSLESVLERAGVADADAMGALTGDLNVNFAACMIAKRYGCRTVLRIDEDYREEIYRKYADDVDAIVYPERLGSVGAKTAMLGGDFNVLADLTEVLQLAVFRIEEGSQAIGRRVNDIDLPPTARIYAHGHHRDPLTIPLPGTTVEAEDRVAVIAEADDFDAVAKTLSNG